MEYFLLLRLTAWILLVLPFALAKDHRSSNSYKPWSPYRVTAKTIGIIIGAVVGAILLIFLLSHAPALYTKVRGSRKGANRERVDQTRTDEEFAIIPLTVPPSASAATLPPYENPPSFEDATKRHEMASLSQPREGHNGRDGLTH